MAICDSCKGNSILPEHYGALTLCKKCSMKILAPTWKNKNRAESLAQVRP